MLGVDYLFMPALNLANILPHFYTKELYNICLGASWFNSPNTFFEHLVTSPYACWPKSLLCHHVLALDLFFSTPDLFVDGLN